MRKLMLWAFISSTMLALLVGLLSNLAATFLAPALSNYPWVVYGALIVTFVVSLPLSAYVFAKTLPTSVQSIDPSTREAPSITPSKAAEAEALTAAPSQEDWDPADSTGIPAVGSLRHGSGMADFAYDVFLSHNRAQKDWTRDLGRRLRDEGFKVWFDEWCLRGGENWIVGLRRGVKESRHVVFVVSPESIDAVWPRFEAYLAIFHDPAADDRKLIPIVHTTCDLPDEMAIRQCIDFSETRGNHLLYEFKVQQLMADLDPSRERPIDFELWVQHYEGEEFDGIPPVRPLPRGSVMLLRANPHFVGREDELQELERHLRAGSATAIGQVAAATGLGGIGKTQLAVEYAHRYGPRYLGGVFWLDMQDPDAISSQVAACGGPEGMGFPGFEAVSLEEQVARVQKEWENATPRLLIFDNVDDSKVVDEWRPVTGGCRVLITSRRTEWPSGLAIEEVRLSTLPRDKAVELLCKGRPEALEDEREREAADAICETLGDLPLAVALAGSYLESYKHDISLTQYLAELRAQPVLEDPALVDFVEDPSPTNHVQNVAATFEVSYRRLDPEDQTDLLAMRLFHLASHFAPVSIRRELLASAAGLDPEEEDRLAADALRRLARLGLIEEEEGGRLLLHRLLGEFARHHPAPGQSEDEAWQAVSGVMLSFAADQYADGAPGLLKNELPHLLHLVTQDERRGWPTKGALTHALGSHLRLTGDYEKAQEYLRAAVTLLVRFAGLKDASGPAALCDLGGVYLALGELEPARECCSRALTLAEDLYGEDDPRVARQINDMGAVLLALGRYSAALDHFRRALVYRKREVGTGDPLFAVGLGNFGMVLRDMGRLEAARCVIQRALSINEAALGTEHVKVANDLNNLGLVLQDMGDLAGAKLCNSRALDILEKELGCRHPRMAAALNNAALVLHHMHRLEEALEKYSLAVEILEEAFGEDHAEVGLTLSNIGGVLCALGDLKGARECYQRALTICRRVYGEDHPRTQTVLRNLKALER